jgi:predicted AAA+ superfamily ATPase
MKSKKIARRRAENAVSASLREFAITTLLGPRQVGKTTLARKIAAGWKRGEVHYFDLEDPTDLARLEQPKTTLLPLKGLVVIDEIQQKPDLFPLLRVLADRDPRPAHFLILGSAAPEIGKRASETLAGRSAFIDLAGFDLIDLSVIGREGEATQRRLWWRGGFPRAYIADTDAAARRWLDNFILTFLERDIPQLGIRVPSTTLRRFWTMVAHYHGQIWNGAEFARSLGTSEPTARHYLDILSGAYVVRQLQPWFENIGKRQVKSPKVYVRDSGLAHALLSVDSHAALEGHPKLGASWEGFAIEQILSVTGDRDAYFWATQSGAELDLLVRFGSLKLGFEIKYRDAPKITKSMRIAVADLGLDQLFVIYPGEKEFMLDDCVEVVCLRKLVRRLAAAPLPEHLIKLPARASDVGDKHIHAHLPFKDGSIEGDATLLLSRKLGSLYLARLEFVTNESATKVRATRLPLTQLQINKLKPSRKTSFDFELDAIRPQ